MIRPLLLGLIALSCAGAPSRAQDAKPAKPLWELGVAGGAGYVADYPAADENHADGLALPYVVYRGEFLRAGDKGIVRGRIVHTDRVELDISLDASFSVDSDSNNARRGMPDLDYLFELGPRLQVTLARAARWAKIDFELPLRAVFSADFFDVAFEGFVLQPTLAYQHENFLESDTALKVALSSIFATEDLQDFFYQVDARFATPVRPAFDAEAGYLGSELEIAALTRLTRRVSLFAVAQAGIFAGAANEASPLFRDELNFSIGGGLIIALWQSERRGRD